MNHFVGITFNFPVFFFNFSCFHQYSREIKFDLDLYVLGDDSLIS